MDEVRGYGGGSCIRVVPISIRAKCVICPNSTFARIVEKAVSFLLTLATSCPSSVTVIPGNPGTIIIDMPSQTSGGSVPSPSPQPITTSNCPKVYSCFGIVETVKHAYLCVDKKNCAGLQNVGTDVCPGGGMITTEKFNSNFCFEMWPGDCCDQCAYAACVTRVGLSQLGECRYYDFFKNNCVDWVTDVLDICMKEACGK
jgi:hypothetical protein